MSELLEKVKKEPTKRTCKNEIPLDIDVAVAWLKEEISLRQVARALNLYSAKSRGINTSSVYCWMAKSLLKAFREGRINVA